MTWGELKTITLQKVFAISDGKLVEDDTTREYLSAMPGAANEALELLATAGRFIKKKAVFRQGGEEPLHAPETPEEQQTGEEVHKWFPLGSGINRYDLGELLEDFYSLDADGVYFNGGTAYYRPANWTMEAGQVFVLPANEAGTWTLWYNAYPPELKANTPEDYELPLYPEVAALLPLYMASQLYKDDDISVATQYRNEFEVGREALMSARTRGHMGKDYWHSTTNWWDW